MLTTAEQAEKLKRIGYDVPCDTIYTATDQLIAGIDCINWNKNIGDKSAPTLTAAAEWLREVKGVHVYAAPHKSRFWYAQIYTRGENWEFFTGITNEYPTHPTALSAGVDAAIDYVLTNHVTTCDKAQ